MSQNPAKKIINDPLKCADELLDGLVLAYDGKARRVGTRSIVMKHSPSQCPCASRGWRGRARADLSRSRRKRHGRWRRVR